MNDKYCPKCGGPMKRQTYEWSCPSCKYYTPRIIPTATMGTYSINEKPKKKFCPYCGANLESEVEG